MNRKQKRDFLVAMAILAGIVVVLVVVGYLT